MDFIIIDDNAEDDDTVIKDEPGYIKPEEEDYPFTIIAVTIGDNGKVEETDEPVFSLNPQTQITTNHEQNHKQEDDSSETDNSEDWNDDSESSESPANSVAFNPDVRQEKDDFRQDLHPCPYCGKEFGRKYNLDNHVRTHTGEKPFSCPVCKKTFTSKTNLNRHMKIHPSFLKNTKSVTSDLNNSSKSDVQNNTKKENFRCSLCSKVFSTQQKLTSHMFRHAKNIHAKPLTCEECGARFKDKEWLDQHMEIHSEDRPHCCTFCNKRFASRDTLRSHMRSHTEERPYNCAVCHKGFKHRANLYWHKKVHTGDRPFSCTICNKTFSRAPGLRSHLATHEKEPKNKKKPFTCPVCRKTLTQNNVRRHMARHEKESKTETSPATKTFSCRHCGAEFAKMLSLSYHERTHNIKRAFRCTICKKGFNVKQTYDLHFKKNCAKPAETERLNGAESPNVNTQLPVKSPLLKSAKPYRCLLCKTSYITKMNYLRHMHTHAQKKGKKRPGSGETSDSKLSSVPEIPGKTYICPICHKQSPSEKKLRAHVQYHNRLKPKPFACDQCPAQYSEQEWLDRHKEIHNADRPFCCEVCNKRFTSLSVYEAHVRIHTGERPYKCTICSKTFKHRSNLRFHVRTHTGEKPFSCPVCYKKFTRNANVRRHLASHTESDKKNLPKGATKLFICRLCGLGFNKEISLDYHKRSHKIKRRFHCRFCKTKSDTKKAFTLHMRMHSCVVKLMRLNKQLKDDDL